MAFTLTSPYLGAQSISLLDTVGPGPTGTPTGLVGGFDSVYNQELQASDPFLGSGTFVFLRYSGTITAGTVCEITEALTSGVVVPSATAWAGTVITGRPLCVAVATTGAVGQWGWFQVQGNAVTTCSGAPVSNDKVYWQAAGVVSPTPVAGKAMVNAQFSTAPAVTIGTGTSATVLGATTAIVYINRPFAQSAIT